MNNVYKMVSKFKNDYKGTVAFRIKKHAEVVQKHLNPDEKLIFAFCGQKNYSSLMLINSCVVALTNKRILVATKRLLWGYFFVTITPDMFNDLTVRKGLIFGSATIDTIKEKVVLSNIDPRALPEIETAITSYMMEEKKKYKNKDD